MPSCGRAGGIFYSVYDTHKLLLQLSCASRNRSRFRAEYQFDFEANLNAYFEQAEQAVPWVVRLELIAL